MSDDRLLSALRRLGEQELPLATDRKIRGRLEAAWTARSRGSAMPSFNIRRFAPVLAAFVLVVGLGGGALGASADSPLWDTRLALESAGAYLRLSPDDRVAYLLDLVQSRTEEAARQEVLGNAGAAARARAAAASAVVELGGDLPHIEVTLPTPVPTPPPTSSPSPSPSPTAPPVPAAQPSASAQPSPARTVAPTPTAVRTPTPTPVRTATPVASASGKATITITGVVRDPAGAVVTGACVTTSATIPTSTASCVAKTTKGTYGFTAPVTPGQTITLYAYLTSATGTLAGSATSPAMAPTTVMPAITLAPRK
jgi:outer membrane biosynthesis protein TonB